ncbi:hypothetical protein EDC94DRAFT_165480 [Helicostylum pulchrum]|nr:hypothetical protein EDC94DRAFT_165480 [Helicostylum pulchrum]
MNTLSTSNNDNKKVMAVKSSIIGIGWKPQYLSNLKKLVHDVHVIVTHTYSFIRYIFIQEPNLNLEEYAVQSFYKEVFLSLLDAKVQSIERLSNKVKKCRDLIYKYKISYLKDPSFTLIKITNAQQIASYEATKIQTAYNNALILHFGNKLRMVIDKLIVLKHRISQLITDLKKKGYSKEEIKSKIKSDIVDPATILKLAISSRNTD